MLDSANDLWAAEGVRLVADLAFVPSAALAEAVRQRLDRYAAGLRDGAGTVTYDGDKRIDYYEQSRLREALAVSRKLAETSGADLRPQIEAIRDAVALYPKSETAGRFPREAAAAAKDDRCRAGEAARRAAAIGAPRSYDAFCSSRSSSLRRSVSAL